MTTASNAQKRKWMESVVWEENIIVISPRSSPYTQVARIIDEEYRKNKSLGKKHLKMYTMSKTQVVINL